MRCFSPDVNRLITRTIRSLVSLAFLVTLTGTCSADVTESANEVLHRVYADHYAGRAIQLISMKQEGDLSAYELTGRFTSYYQAPDKQSGEIDLGVIRVAQFFDGINAYMLDQNGNLLELSGFERAVMVNSTYLVSSAYLDDGERGGKKEYLGTLSFAGRGCHHFRFFPPTGSPVEVIIDSINGAILKSSSTLDDMAEETTYSDFRNVDGIAIPFLQRSSRHFD